MVLASADRPALVLPRAGGILSDHDRSVSPRTNIRLLGQYALFDHLVERGQQRHQPLHGKAGELVPAKRGHLGLVHPKHSGGFLLRQLALVEDLIECIRQAKLRLP